MLTYIDESNDDTLRSIVSWNEDGRTFYVRDQDKFEVAILPKFFIKQTRYRSFQRQLNFYNFKRITKGPFEGSYGHPLCIKRNESLAQKIERCPKATASMKSVKAKQERSTITSSGLPQQQQRCRKVISIPTSAPSSLLSMLAWCTNTITTASNTTASNTTFVVENGNDYNVCDDLEPIPVREALPQKQHQYRRRSTLILMDRLHFTPENFFQYDTDNDE
jgi:hypothetical protein